MVSAWFQADDVLLLAVVTGLGVVTAAAARMVGVSRRRFAAADLRLSDRQQAALQIAGERSTAGMIAAWVREAAAIAGADFGLVYTVQPSGLTLQASHGLFPAEIFRHGLQDLDTAGLWADDRWQRGEPCIIPVGEFPDGLQAAAQLWATESYMVVPVASKDGPLVMLILSVPTQATRRQQAEAVRALAQLRPFVSALLAHVQTLEETERALDRALDELRSRASR